MTRNDRLGRRWLMTLMVLGLLPCGNAAWGSLADCLDATCRITTADGSRGTGCAFERSQGYVFVLTAAHVVGDQRQVQCEFWRAGHCSTPLAAMVLAADASADAAVVCVPEDSFAGLPPTCIPVAPRDYVLQEGQTVASVGCAKGAWATGFQGHVIGYSDGSLCFTPPPADGRSGSAVFDARGERIVALVWGRSDTEGRGYAVTVENLYRALNFRRTAAGWTHAPLPMTRTSLGTLERAGALETVGLLQPMGTTPAQCGPNGCPTDGYLLPYRNDQLRRDEQQGRRLDDLDQRIERQERVWPTLPPQGGSVGNAPPWQPIAGEQETPGAGEESADEPIGGLGVVLALVAAGAVGVFLFYVMGKQ